MPQLDIGIYYLEFFFNFFFFWFIYIIKAKKIFPFLNKTLKLRKYKIKELDIYLNFYINNFFSLNLTINNYKNIFNLIILKNLNFFFFKIYFSNILILKNFNYFFFIKNINNIEYFFKEQFFLNKV